MNRNRVKEILEQEEGRENEKYLDSQGNWTIGVGHLFERPVEPDAYVLATGDTVAVATALPDDVGEIPDDAIDAILDDDIDTALADAAAWIIGDSYSSSQWHSLSWVRKEVCVHMSFQLGGPTLNGFVQTRQAILDGDWQRAHDEMLDSDWAENDTPARANRMADAMLTNDPDEFYE